MLTLHLEADTHADLVATAMKVLGLPLPSNVKDGGDAPPTRELSALQAALAAPAPVVLPTPAPRVTRGRKPKVSEPAAAPSSAPALPEAPAAVTAAPVASVLSSTAAPSVEDVRAALGEMNSAFGMAACTALLGEFGAQRVSLVPEARRAEFIAACKDRVGKNVAKPA